jgi:hypothetical protein
MSDRAQVHPDLMSPARVDRNPTQGHAAEMVSATNPCHGLPRTSGSSGHFLPMHWIAPNGSVNAPSRVHHAPYKRDVLLFNFSIVKLSRELLMRRIILGNHHHARRPAIESMHDAGPCFAADAAEIGHVVKERVDERAGRMTRARMDHHASLLVQHGDVAVLVENLKRERLTSHPGRYNVGQSDRHAIALVNREVCACVTACDGHVPVGDQLLDLRSGMTLENRDEEAIEPLAVGLGRNRELDRHSPVL